jgi:hypothetical protein
VVLPWFIISLLTRTLCNILRTRFQNGNFPHTFTISKWEFFLTPSPTRTDKESIQLKQTNAKNASGGNQLS